jgi:uncharacterized protein with HEPN domain
VNSDQSCRQEFPWKRIGAMRDKLIHDYFGLNLDIGWAVVENELPKLEQAIANLLQTSR